MSIKEFSIQLYELGVYHTLEDINSIQTLKVDDDALSAKEAHILHTLIADKESAETALTALKILARHFEVDIIEASNICKFRDS